MQPDHSASKAVKLSRGLFGVPGRAGPARAVPLARENDEGSDRQSRGQQRLFGGRD